MNEARRRLVTPLAGVWIEMCRVAVVTALIRVTPLAGVWIEIFMVSPDFLSAARHSPCGSVD